MNTEPLLFHLTSLSCHVHHTLQRCLKPHFSYLGSGGFCDCGLVTLRLEAVHVFSPSLAVFV